MRFLDIVVIVPPPVHPNPCTAADGPNCQTIGEAYPWLWLFPIGIVLGLILWGLWSFVSWIVYRVADSRRKRWYR